MRKIYTYEADRWEYVEDANHKCISWKERLPYEITFKNCTKYDLKIVRQTGGQSVILNKDESKTIVSHYMLGRFLVITPKGWFWFEEEGGVVIGREVRPSFLQNDVVPIWNNGVIEFWHNPKKQNHSIKPVQNPDYQVKVRNYTPYDVIIWLDDDIIEVVKSHFINTIFLPNGNHMLHFDTKEEEYFCHPKFGLDEDFIGPINGCQMKIIDSNEALVYMLQEMCNRKRGHAERKLNTMVGPGSIEPYIRHLYASYNREEKMIDIWCNTIDYRLD